MDYPMPWTDEEYIRSGIGPLLHKCGIRYKVGEFRPLSKKVGTKVKAQGGPGSSRGGRG